MAGGKGKTKNADVEDDDRSMPVGLLSSSDTDEAREDFTIEIIEKSRQLGRALPHVFLTSGSSDEVEVLSGTSTPITARRKKINKLKKKKENKKPEINAHSSEDEPIVTTASVITEVLEKTENHDRLINNSPDNAVMRKLLRGPRYFEPVDNGWSRCYNCGEEGHIAVDCTMEKRQRPCFVCGLFGHKAQQCTQRRGNRPKDCQNKSQSVPQNSKFCLRCGGMGHEMSSCNCEYASDDMKEIQCYICQKYGHLCCADFIDDGPKEVFCYNCAQPGHTGAGCAKSRGEAHLDMTPTLCYKCGEQGHFARGCTNNNIKPDKYLDELLITPHSAFKHETLTQNGKFNAGQHSYLDRRHVTREDGNFNLSRSVPHYLPKKQKRKPFQYEEVAYTTPKKSRPKGGWFVDDPGDTSWATYKNTGRGSFHRSGERAGNFGNVSWPKYKNSASASNREGYRSVASGGGSGRYPSSQSPVKKFKFSYESLGPHYLKYPVKHGYSTSRFSRS